MYNDKYRVRHAKEGEKGYPWFFFYPRRPWMYGLIVTLLVIGLSGSFYIWYSHYGAYPNPDGMVGLSYAFLGLTFLALAMLAYSIRRRSHKRATGQLNAALNWHVFFALMGLALLFMHSFGNFDALSGTYALYSMVGLTVSGLVGRALDGVLARLIAVEVQKALEAEDKVNVEALTTKGQAITGYDMQGIHAHSFAPHATDLRQPPLPSARKPGRGLLVGQWSTTSWDLGYISLEETVQGLNGKAQDGSAIVGGERVRIQSRAVIPGAQEQLAALQTMQHAMQREQFYRYVIKYWRKAHIALALLTVGLTIWHLIYAAQLLLFSR